MPRPQLPAQFEDVEAADNVRIDIGSGALEALSHAGLPGQVKDQFRGNILKDRSELAGIHQHAEMGIEAGMPFKQGVASLLELDVVVRSHSVDARHFMALLKKAPGEMKSDEARGSRDQTTHRYDLFVLQSHIRLSVANYALMMCARVSPWREQTFRVSITRGDHSTSRR